MSEPLVADPGWSLVWCRGEDARSFLQGLLSADLTAESGSVVRSFLLEPNGKLTALLWVLIGEDELGLVCDTGVVDGVLAALTRFRIRVKADLELSQASVHLVVGDQQAPKGEWRRDGSRLVADVSRRGTDRTIVVGEVPPFSAMTADAYAAHRIQQGEPVSGVDVGSGTIPQETRLVGEAVSFTKGCYLGQELVARIDTRGHVNQRLMRIESAGEFSVGDVVRFEDREAVVTSSATVPEGTVGLAVVRREVADGSSVTIGVTPGTVYDLPE